jgi:hypothetical protein
VRLGAVPKRTRPPRDRQRSTTFRPAFVVDR